MDIVIVKMDFMIKNKIIQFVVNAIKIVKHVFGKYFLINLIKMIYLYYINIYYVSMMNIII